ncbi:MAG: hypothetical protein WD894_12880 [Pirellulales bacterium]
MVRKAKRQAIPDGTPFDTLMRRLAKVPREELAAEEKKYEAAKQKRQLRKKR